MTITLPLEPKAEARFMALAQEKGVTAGELVSQSIEKIIAEAAQPQPKDLPVWHLGGTETYHRREIYDDAV